jgi:hypothetical protein
MVIFIQNSSVSTGAGLTGLTNASAGLIWYYYRDDATAATVVSVVNETLGTWTSGGFKEIDAAHLPGFYEIGVPNAVLAATNAPAWATMQLSGATSMVPVNIEIQLVAFDPQDAVHLGLSALPNAAAASAGGLPTSGAGANQIDLDASGRVDVGKWLSTLVTAATAGIPDVNTKNINNLVATTDGNNLLKVDVEDWHATAVSVPATAGVVDVNVKNYNNFGVVTDVANLQKVDAEDWKGGVIVAPATTGIPDVNAKNIGNVVAPTFPTNFASLAITVGGAVTLNVGQITVKKNVALAGFTFPMFSSTTGNLATGLTVTAQRSIDGAAVAPCANGVVEVSSGLYSLNLAASDLNGNSITVIFTATNAIDQAATFITQP